MEKNMNNNQFIKAMVSGAGSSMTENGAKSYASMGTTLLDQFSKAGTNRGRELDLVFTDQANLWNENPEMALKFPFYLRMITRQTKMMNGEKTEKVQKGQGARDEAFKRLLWIEKYHPDVFYRNLWLLPIVGSWKDIWVMLSMSKNANKQEYFRVLAEGINDKEHRDLVKKYMPRIRSINKCTTEWAKTTNKLAKEFANFAGWTYEEYRQFKSTGKAHAFQKYICSGLYSKIDWNTIPGKALLNLVSGNFLKNHNLEKKYMEWLDKQPVAKFNGYVFELAKKFGNSYSATNKAVQMTVDKQFANLIETAKKDDGGIKGNVWVGLDTSGSMNIPVHGTGLTALDIAKSLAIYFATLNEGAFHNYVMGFDNRAWLHKLSGESFTEKWFGKMPRVGCGGTNFQSIIDEIVRIRKDSPEIPESDFPQTIVVVSDMQFNPTNNVYDYWNKTPSTEHVETNYEACVRKLREAGFSEEFLKNWKMVWWFCVNRETNDFPSNMDCPGTYMFSGFDPAIATLILGGQQVVDKDTGEKRNPTMEEIVETALTQEVLMLVH